MAHPPALRARAYQCYLADWPRSQIVRELGVSRATLVRWIRSGDWPRRRAEAKELEREAGALLLEMTRAARVSRDPQQTYAAMQAAELAGLRAPVDPGPRPTEVAKRLLQALAAHAELGPLVRKHRAEVIATVMREVERMEGVS